MPFKSEKQRRYLFANEPEIAKKWSEEYNMGGVASMFRKRLAEGDDPFYEAWKKIYEINPDAAAQNENHDEYLEKYKLEMSMQTSDAPMEETEETTEVVEETTDPLLNLFQPSDTLASDQAMTTLFTPERPEGIMAAANGGSIDFAMQGGVKNYLGEQETVSDVPVKWQSGPDKPETELAYITKAEKDLILKKDLHGSLKDGPNTGPEGLMSLDSQGDKGTYGDTGQSYGDRQTTDKSPEVGDKPSAQDLQEYEKNREIREYNQRMADKAKKESKNLSFDDKWGKWNDKYDKLNKYSFTGPGVKKRATLTTQNYKEDRAALEKKFGKNLISKIALSFLGVPVSIGFKDVKAVKDMYDLEKQYKADMQNLKDISIDKGWTDFHHAVDTPMQTIDQLLSDTITVNKDDEDTSPDGPEVKPITLEVDEEYAQGENLGFNMMTALDKIRENQAIRSGLVARDIIQDNKPMLANKGGLAGLFRVKNQ